MNDLLLIVETTMQGISLGLSQPSEDTNALKWQKSDDTPQGTARSLSLCLESGLESLSKDIRDISYIAISHGPGSFTGIKIGLSWAYGLKAANPNIKFKSVSGLSCAAKFCHKNVVKKDLQLVFPSTRTHGYQVFVNDDQAKVDLITVDQNEIGQAHLFEPRDQHEVVLIGAWPALQEKMAKLGREFLTFTHKDIAAWSIKGIFLEAIGDIPVGFSDALPQPLYMRQSTAEEKRQRKGES